MQEIKNSLPLGLLLVTWNRGTGDICVRTGERVLGGLASSSLKHHLPYWPTLHSCLKTLLKKIVLAKQIIWPGNFPCHCINTLLLFLLRSSKRMIYFYYICAMIIASYFVIKIQLLSKKHPAAEKQSNKQ